MTTVMWNDLVSTMKYPAGEPHVRIAKFMSQINKVICPDVRDFNDLMQIVLVDETLKHLGHEATFYIPYFPFARHDRKNDEADTSPLIHAISLMRGVQTVIVDPHSDVAGLLAYIPQSEVVYRFADQGLFDNDPVVVIPDAGAAKKVYTWLDGRDCVQAIKKRDPATGKLSGFRIVDYIEPGRAVVIVDDICDGGGTFIGLAEKLREIGVSNMRLAVTHGLFTKGLTTLFDHFTRIYTLDCYAEYSFPACKKINTIELIENGNVL